MYKISELMTRNPIALTEGQSLSAADAWMERGEIRHLPVVRGGKVVGLITQRDLLRHTAREHPVTGKPLLARDLMVREVMSVRPESLLKDAIRLMRARHFCCLPVTNADGTLVGILTNSDLVRIAGQHAEDRDLQDLVAALRD
jgi:CBS domain-containing protein